MPQAIRRSRPRRADLTGAIVESAIGLFAKRGYEATTMQDVAAAVGVTAPALYYHFDSKQALLYAVVEFNLRRILERLEGAVGGVGDDPTRQLTAFVETHLNFQLERVDRARVYNAMFLGTEALLSALGPGQRARITQLQDRVAALLKAILERGRASGAFAVDDVTLSALGIMALGEFAPAWFRPTGRLSAKQVAAGYAALAVRIVTPSLGEGRRGAGWTGREAR